MDFNPLNLVGSVIGAAGSYFGTKDTNRTNSALAHQQMQWSGQQAWDQRDWEEKMLNKQLAEGDVRWARDAQREDTVAATQWNRSLDAMARAQGYNHDLLTRQLDFQRESVNSAQAFNREMSNTSYQRGMADMKAAGLNPMLAFGQGGATSPSSPALGAPTPSGPTASAALAGTPRQSIPGVGGVGLPSYQRANAVDALGPAISTAMQGAKFMTEIEGMKSVIDRTRSETSLNEARGVREIAETGLVDERKLSEPVRRLLLGLQAASERGRPGHIAASTDAALASARAALAQADLSDERRRQVIQEIDQVERFGRPGHWGNLFSTGETAVRRAEEYRQQAIQGARSWADENLPRPYVAPRAEARGGSVDLGEFMDRFARALGLIQ